MTCAVLSLRAAVEQARLASVASAAEEVGPSRPLHAEAPLREFRVVGIVRAERGSPIGGARVRANSVGAEGVTDRAGAYELSFSLREAPAPRLHFSAKGYQDEEVALRPSEFEGFEAIQVDVALAPLGSHAVVTGVLVGAGGEPIPFETAQLQSTPLNTRYAAVSDAAGAFSIPGVRVGGAYDLIVHPARVYAGYSRRGIDVPPEGLALEVVLEPLAARRLAGRMIDADGRPVPGFGLWIRSDRDIELRGDGAGRFAVERVPPGDLQLTTRSPPRHVIRGIRPAGEGEEEVEIVIDSGDRRLEGRVLDERGNPIAGAQLDLAWLHHSGAVQSSSIRRSVSDVEGAFHFDALGPGPHLLTASAAEHRAPAGAIEVAPGAGAAEIRLDRVPR